MTAWPEWVLLILVRLDHLTPEDLPPAPWVLSDTTGRATTSGTGSRPVVTVEDTATWLDRLRFDAYQGHDGPRAKNGGLQEDLRNLDRVLKCKAASEGKLFLCAALGCGWLLEKDEKPERCYCGAELGERAGWRAERWAGVEGPHTRDMNKKTQSYGF